jgi:autotransporter-associated beta strand protein
MLKVYPCLVAAFLTVTATSFAGPGVSNPYGGKRVLVIGIDGLRSDALLQQVQTGNAPNIAGLIANGTVSWNAYAGGDLNTATQQPTISGPGWASILSGTWIDRHNVNGNATTAYNQPTVLGSYMVNQAPHFARLLEESVPGTHVSSIVSWSWIEDYIVAAQPSWLDYHTKGSGSSYALRDADVTSKAVAHLGVADPDVLFLHYDQIDGAGHTNGFSTTVPGYMSAISTVDAHVGSVLSAISARPQIASEQWLVILTSDHGGTGTSHGGQTPGERTIPLIVSGGGVPVSVSPASPGHVAVVPTLMRYLGVGIPASWQFAQNAFVTGPAFTAANVSGSVSLNWSLPVAGIPGVTGFQLSRNGSSIGTFPLAQRSFTDSSAPLGQSIYQLIFSGTSEAPLSASIYVTGPGQIAWDDANSNNNWNTINANWSGAAVFANGLQALFSGDVGETVTIDPAGVSPSDTAIVGNGSYAFTGGSIAGTITKGGSGTLGLLSSNNFSSVALNGGSLALGNSQSLGAGTLTVATTASKDTAAAAMISTTAMTANASFPNPISLPVETVVSNRTLYMHGTGNGSNTVEFSGKISGGSPLTTLYLNNNQSGSFNPQFILSNSSNDFRASILINRGGLQIPSDAALGNAANTVTFNSNAGADLTFANAMTYTRATTLSTATDFDTRSNNVTASGIISGGSSLTKLGSGTLSLGAANTYSGSTTVTAGTLQISGSAVLGSGTYGGGISITAGGTLQHASSTAQTFSGIISGAGQLGKTGSAALTLSGANTYSGGTFLSGGPNSASTAAIRLANNSALGTGDVILGNTATLTAFYNSAASQTISNNIQLSPTAGVTTNMLVRNATTLQLDGLISGGTATSTLYVNTDTGGGSTGLFRLTNPGNTFQGKIQINRGGLAIPSDGALGDVSNSIVIDIGTGTQIGLRFDGPVSSSRNIQLGSNKQVFDTNGNDVMLSGVISGTGQLYKSGSGKLVLSNTHTYGSITTVDNGSLVVNGALSASTSAVSVLTTGRLGGSGTINRPVTVSGNLSPGNDGVGTLTIANAITLGASSSCSLQFANWSGAAGTGHDSIAANALSITAGTSSKLSLNLDFTGMVGFSETTKSFAIATSTTAPSGLTAENWSIQTINFPGSGTWALALSGNSLVLNYTATLRPFASWIASKGLSSADAAFTADPDRDGLANGIEFVLGSEPNPTHPSSNSSASLPTVSASGASLVFTYRHADAASGMLVTVEFSDSLQGPWITAEDPLNATISSSDGSPLDTITVSIPKGSHERLFARMKVVEPD